MAEARDRDEWDRLGWLLAEIDNAGKSLARSFSEDEIEPTLPDDKNMYVLIARAEKEEAAGGVRKPRRAPGVAEYDPRVLQARQDRATRGK
jgi:predicted regulator of Ras-like GTPase activity (Roadblock/LC7/MglB family)